MDIEGLLNQLPGLRSEAATWRQREDEARGKAESIERIIEGIEGLREPTVSNEPLPGLGAAPKQTAPPANGDGPRGIAAVRRVILEAPDRTWKARDVHTQLEQRGWISPGAQHPLRGTEAAINRLVKRGELERLRPGRYRATEAMRSVIEEED